MREPKQNGRYDKRNRLNDLTGKEWLQLSKSVWISQRCAEDKDAFKHPAPFLIKDISKLIRLFTKKGDLVLDPFMGSGTTLIASSLEGRKSIGIDLNKIVDLGVDENQTFVCRVYCDYRMRLVVCKVEDCLAACLEGTSKL
jgi:DNA modification methylase